MDRNHGSLLPSAALVEALIQLSNEVVAEDKLPCFQSRNSASMIRRIKLLSSLFEEIRDSNNHPDLPPSSILCLTELFSTIRKVKLLMRDCKGRAALWNLLQAEAVAREFHLSVKDMGNALDILPLSLLDVPPDVREQVELLHRQVKRANHVLVDKRDSGRRERLFQLMGNKAGTDRKRIEEFFCELGLRSASDFREEICRLVAEIQKQAGTGGLVVVSNLNNLISLVEYSKSLIFNDDNNISAEDGQRKQDRRLDHSMASHNFPDEFRCPITLDLMRDPVIISSGHSYDRSAIAQWINSGHHSCPKSGRKLIHTALIPNFALKSLISQWCQDHDVSLTAAGVASSSSSRALSEERFGNIGMISSVSEAVDHISATKSAVDAVKLTADFLVGKLATGSTEIRRQAALELRLLARTGMVNRRIIAEAGAIPFLVTLLGAHDQRTQENAVTTLLNLSIFDNNKLLIMEAGAIDGIVEVLRKGRSMEARENAAATIISLSMIDKSKITIGTHSAVMLGLVELLREGTSTGKRDAAMALFNLGLHNPNRARVIAAGVIPLLVELLVDEKAGITDEALAVLALLAGNPEGLREIGESKTLVPLLVDLIRFGSPKGKENSLSLLLVMCRNGEEVAKSLLLNPQSIPSLWTQVSNGSPKARRKADALLRLLNRHFSQSQSSSTTDP